MQPATDLVHSSLGFLSRATTARDVVFDRIMLTLRSDSLVHREDNYVKCVYFRPSDTGNVSFLVGCTRF